MSGCTAGSARAEERQAMKNARDKRVLGGVLFADGRRRMRPEMAGIASTGWRCPVARRA